MPELIPLPELPPSGARLHRGATPEPLPDIATNGHGGARPRLDPLPSAAIAKRLSVASAHQDLSALTDDEEKLFTAIAFGKIHKVPALLRSLRHTEVRDQTWCTPLLHTARNARGEHLTHLVKQLVKAGCDVNAADRGGVTSLMYLCQRNAGESADAVRSVLRSRDCDPDAKDEEGNTALMLAAGAGNCEAVALLLFLPAARRHADVHARNRSGASALDAAVQAGHHTVTQMLVEEGKADVSRVRDKAGFHSLYHGHANGHVQVEIAVNGSTEVSC